MPSQNTSHAEKIWISEILNGDYSSGDDKTPAQITCGKKTFSKVNLLGVVINKTVDGPQEEIQTIEIEDTTGKIPARTFDSKKAQIEVGDCIFLIGRPRMYNQQKYLIIDIAKKITQQEWIEVRQKELPLPEITKKEQIQEIQKEDEDIDTNIAKIISIIHANDTGMGADYDLVIKQSNTTNAENIINMLIKKGEIFNVSPTKIKVLE